jgi:hypothetical protein
MKQSFLRLYIFFLQATDYGILLIIYNKYLHKKTEAKSNAWNTKFGIYSF